MDINWWLYNVILIKVYDNSIKVKKYSTLEIIVYFDLALSQTL